MFYRKNSKKERSSAKRKKRKKEIALNRSERTKEEKRFKKWVLRLRGELKSVMGLEMAVEFLSKILTDVNFGMAASVADCGYNAFKFVLLFSHETSKVLALPQSMFFTLPEFQKIQKQLSARGFNFKATRTGEPSIEEIFLKVVSGGAIHESEVSTLIVLPEWEKPLVIGRPGWTPLYLAAKFFDCDQEELLRRIFHTPRNHNPSSVAAENDLPLVKILLDRLAGKNFGHYYNLAWEEELTNSRFLGSKNQITPLAIVSKLMSINQRELTLQLKQNYPQFTVPKPTTAQQTSVFKRDINQDDKNQLLHKVVVLLRSQRRLSFDAIYNKLSRMNLNVRCEDPDCFEIHSLTLDRHTLEVSLKGVARETCACDRWECPAGSIHYDDTTNEYYYRASRKTRSKAGKKITKQEKKKRKRKRPH